jgi:Ca2+-binding EF-hand superfamily protein
MKEFSMKKSVAVVGIAACLLSGAAIAGDGEMKSTKSAASFASLDSNKDGMISQSEAAKHQDLTAGFATADANRDGGLSEGEFNDWATGAKARSVTEPATSGK